MVRLLVLYDLASIFQAAKKLSEQDTPFAAIRTIRFAFG